MLTLYAKREYFKIYSFSEGRGRSLMSTLEKVESIAEKYGCNMSMKSLYTMLKSGITSLFPVEFSIRKKSATEKFSTSMAGEIPNSSSLSFTKYMSRARDNFSITLPTIRTGNLYCDAI